MTRRSKDSERAFQAEGTARTRALGQERTWLCVKIRGRPGWVRRSEPGEKWTQLGSDGWAGQVQSVPLKGQDAFWKRGRKESGEFSVQAEGTA